MTDSLQQEDSTFSCPMCFSAGTLLDLTEMLTVQCEYEDKGYFCKDGVLTLLSERK